jgi:hypothetical protein
MRQLLALIVLKHRKATRNKYAVFSALLSQKEPPEKIPAAEK